MVPPRMSGTKEGVLGIDLGTTHTAAVAFGPGGEGPLSILHGRDRPVIPSVVSLKNPVLPLVGWLAKDMMLTEPTTTIYGWKRFLGRNLRSDYVQRHLHRFPYDIQKSLDGELGAVVGGRVFSFVEVATYMLDQVRLQAGAALQTELKRAVITVPAHFTNRQRTAVIEAGTRAGLEVMRLVNEPTAAALAFGVDQGLDTRVLVFDLGGGTFDATVLELIDNIFEVRATAGEPFLGGLDFDRAVRDRLVEVCHDHFQVKVDESPVVEQRILNAAEAAKCALSTADSHRLRVAMVGHDSKGRIFDLDYTMRRRELDSLVAPLVERCLGIVDEMMAKANLSPKDINHIITVGGQTQMPLVQRRIKEAFGREPLGHLDPETAIAHGAALVAASEGDLAGAILLDVLSVPIGVVFPGGRTEWVFDSHTRLPALSKVPLEPPSGNQLSVGVWQGPDLASAERQALGVVHVPRHLFGSGSQPTLEFKLNDELDMSVEFQSSVQRVPLTLESP